MKFDIHGNLSHDSLLEQYKLYAELANEISKRRDQTNNFYISLSSALIALFSLIVVKLGSDYTNFIVLLPLLGLLICFTWYIHIKSYKQLNSAKFKVINKLEKQLPYAGFTEEWDILQKNNYRQLTEIESYTPIIIGCVYLILLILVIYNLIW